MTVRLTQLALYGGTTYPMAGVSCAISIFFLTANCKLYHSAMKPTVTHNVPKLMYLKLTKLQTCNGNIAPRGRF